MPVSRKTITKAKPARRTVKVPELGGEVIVQGLRLSQRLELAAQGNESRFLTIARLLAWCCVDQAGDPLMSLDDWETWGGVHTDAAVRLLEVAQQVSGLAPADTAGK